MDDFTISDDPIDLHEITRERVVKFLLDTEHLTFAFMHDVNPTFAENTAIGGAMTMLMLLVQAEGFLTVEQVEAVAVIANQLLSDEAKQGLEQ